MALPSRFPRAIIGRDGALTRAFDALLFAAARRAGPHVTCHRGCTPCCIGAFDVTALDAARLRRGLRELEAARPRLAAAVRRRATAQWREQRGAFSGDPGGRRLAGDDGARERFFAALGDVPCPALNPRSGACDLYASRPLSCRSYGLPIRCGGVVLPPCPLNFTAATAAGIAAATVEPDPHDVESELLAKLREIHPEAGDTTVAAALADAD